MKFRMQISRFVLFCLLIIKGSLLFSNEPVFDLQAPQAKNKSEVKMRSDDSKIADLNIKLLSFISSKNFLLTNDTAKAGEVVVKILKQIKHSEISIDNLSNTYYYAGVYYSMVNECNKAINSLNQCERIFLGKNNKSREDSVRYLKVLYNISVVYFKLGNDKLCEAYALNSLLKSKILYGDSNPELLKYYTPLVSAQIEQKEYEKAKSNSNEALLIANSNLATIAPNSISDIYYDLGVCYTRLGDFSKAKIYFDKSESIYLDPGLQKSDSYINLLNSLAIIYSELGLSDQAEIYYKKGVQLSRYVNTVLAYNLINSYSFFLALKKETGKGEKILEEAVSRAKSSTPEVYYEVLNNYANFLCQNKMDLPKSISCYEQCLLYLGGNNQNVILRNSVYTGYAKALEANGNPEKALGVIESLLMPGLKSNILSDNYINPPSTELEADLSSLRMLGIKYNLLWDIYNKTGDKAAIEAASKTSELTVTMLDKVRINISEEESRLKLGDKYRETYINAIKDFNLLYNKTKNGDFFEKAFEYSERSKVAGLLASTRELKASQFHIPVATGNLELELHKEISLLNARISEETAKNQPNEKLISSCKENLLRYTIRKDSLVSAFEKQYPEYYSLKYNTDIIGLKDIPRIIGHNGNYITYIVSNNTLYVFVVNNKFQQLIATPIDSTFFNDIKTFRDCLSMPSSSENERLKFKKFQETGIRLYKVLLEPVKPYLISDKVVISPDNMLSYLPFETIPVSTLSGDLLRYGSLHYVMDDLDISYAYSATFMAESQKRESSSENTLIAFAPDYPNPIDIQEALMSRHGDMGLLNDLPYARQEAAYVAGITNGTLYENSEAKESVYKIESGKFDIIHLAMHTLLNDKDPMRSTLIFSQLKDSANDGYLKTYEIYGIPLKAKMVVLSSCNTGSGVLSSGEGILSLARGFIYSGSQSVVMSMWEIEDKSGTEIVKMFYDNLKKGYSKSTALKKARIVFLKNADHLHSHPYFWSALVVYGNNSPLYHSNNLKIVIPALVFLILILGYFYLRKYS